MKSEISRFEITQNLKFNNFFPELLIKPFEFRKRFRWSSCWYGAVFCYSTEVPYIKGSGHKVEFTEENPNLTNKSNEHI